MLRLLKQRHLLLQVIDLLSQALYLSGQKVEGSGWRLFRLPLVPGCAIPGRMPIAGRRTLSSHAESNAKFGAPLRVRLFGIGRIDAYLRTHENEQETSRIWSPTDAIACVLRYRRLSQCAMTMMGTTTTASHAACDTYTPRRRGGGTGRRTGLKIL
jgi:hypothetical protein